MIFISRNGEVEPKTGSFLGELTDELEDFGKGSYITTFVSTGPKSYAFQGYSSETGKEFENRKVKGFTLNYETSKLINLESLCNVVEEDNNSITVSSRNIRRTRDRTVISRPETKVFNLTGEKRKFFEDFSSLPYGHNKISSTKLA